MLNNNWLGKTTLCLTQRQLCDLECILNGTFAPLTGFLNEDDYNSVCQNMRLANGELWPMPITLDVSFEFASQVHFGEQIVLTNTENTPLALMTINSKWQANKEQEALLVFGTTDHKHPGVNYLYNHAGIYYLGGEVNMLSPILHFDFLQYRHTPNQLKQLFKEIGWSKIIAFQTRNPIHRAHYELMQRASAEVGAKLLIHPVVGMTRAGDVDYVTRVHCYEAVISEFNKNSALLSLLPLAMRMAGPREALWHALIRKNYGVTHFIIGRDHAGPGLNSNGVPFYDPYDAQRIAQQYQDEIGITCVPFSAIVYVKAKQRFYTIEELDPKDQIDDISGTELRHKLANGLSIPEWFTFPSVSRILQQVYPPKHQQGFTIFFTGLSGAGKSTIAKALIAYLQTTETKRKITLLDGDVVRRNLSDGLTFSKQDRENNIRRISYVASEITKHGGIAICAAIAPYTSMRQQMRSIISEVGGFIEVYVATPLSICKERDLKGLYRKAELGLIKNFTGIDDPYETPTNPDLIIDTSITSVYDSISKILTVLMTKKYILQDYSHTDKIKNTEFAELT